MGIGLKLDYALNIEKYSVKNALTYGIFQGHFREAFYKKDSSYGRRFVHFLIVVAELVPITAIFELIIVKGFASLCEKNTAPVKKSSLLATLTQNTSRNVCKEPSYETLPNASEKANIDYIITTFATSYVASILWNKKSLLKAYSDLARIHPLRFIAYVYDDKDLKAKMSLMKRRRPISLFNKTFSIWNKFILLMSYRLTSHMTDRKKFDKDYADFARHLELKPPKSYPRPVSTSLPQDKQHTKVDLASSFIFPIEEKF